MVKGMAADPLGQYRWHGDLAPLLGMPPFYGGLPELLSGAGEAAINGWFASRGGAEKRCPLCSQRRPSGTAYGLKTHWWVKHRTIAERLRFPGVP